MGEPEKSIQECLAQALFSYLSERFQSSQPAIDFTIWGTGEFWEVLASAGRVPVAFFAPILRARGCRGSLDSDNGRVRNLPTPATYLRSTRVPSFWLYSVIRAFIRKRNPVRNSRRKVDSIHPRPLPSASSNGWCRWQVRTTSTRYFLAWIYVGVPSLTSRTK
jgi:hypothetical protein